MVWMRVIGKEYSAQMKRTLQSDTEIVYTRPTCERGDRRWWWWCGGGKKRGRGAEEGRDGGKEKEKKAVGTDDGRQTKSRKTETKCNTRKRTPNR